jgi:hypothetical protein
MIAAALITSGCTGDRVVNTGEPPVRTETATSTPAPSTPASNAHLVNAFHYVAHVDGQARYYFVTPSGKWRCAIVPQDKAGCQAASSWQSGLNLPGEPATVANAAGEPTTPNAIVLGREGDAR